MKPEIITNRLSIGANEEVAVYKPANLTPDSPVLFALHGNWATRKRNERYGEFFSDRGFLVIAPTYRYHSAEKQKDPAVLKALGKTSTNDYVEDVMSLIFNLEAGILIPGFNPERDVVVMGHSMGGLVAQCLASTVNWLDDNYPAGGPRVAALITLCSAPPAGVSLHTDEDYKNRLKKKGIGNLIIGGKPYKPDLETYSLYVANNMPKEEYEEIYKKALYESGTSSREILAGSGSGFVSALASFFSKRKIKVDGSKFNCPVLVVGCEKDRIVPKEVAIDLWRKYRKEVAKDLPVDFHIFPQFAHWVQYEPGWEASANYIFEWLQDNVLDNVLKN